MDVIDNNLYNKYFDYNLNEYEINPTCIIWIGRPCGRKSVERLLLHVISERPESAPAVIKLDIIPVPLKVQFHRTL